MDIVSALTIFVLAGFVGYYLIWGITPNLHAPLMSVSNAISGIIIIGAIPVAGQADSFIEQIFTLLAIIAASINVFGGFILSQRMLQMFRPKNHKDSHHE